jgi:hypothetical protein
LIRKEKSKKKKKSHLAILSISILSHKFIKRRLTTDSLLKKEKKKANYGVKKRSFDNRDALLKL